MLASASVIRSVHPLRHADGRQIATVDALSNRTTMVFDAGGRVVNFIDALNNTTTFVYDAVGHKTEEIDPLGHTATFAYVSRTKF